MNTFEEDTSIVTAIIGLAHNLGLEVTAEGVETSEQLNYLLINNCDRVQGFYFSKALIDREAIGVEFSIAEVNPTNN